MKTTQNVNGLSMLPRQDGSQNGWIGRHEVYLSSDGTNWGSPVASGSWFADSTTKYSNFETRPARYVRLVAVTEANGQPWTSIAEINVFQASSYTAPSLVLDAGVRLLTCRLFLQLQQLSQLQDESSCGLHTVMMHLEAPLAVSL
ncbi:hypothetical protein NXS19_010713 [Fusarium pseudograminearum]|nr:hypothetical protein NXS19_010713 [Fusarium pseudograminearum]